MLYSNNKNVTNNSFALKTTSNPQLEQLIEESFECNKVFLNSRLTAQLLGALLKVNSREITAIVKNKYGISFRDYINIFRLNYIKEEYLDKGLLKKYSLEYIIEKGGFGTRQSFYVSIKKHINCHPKDFLNSKTCLIQL